MARYQTSMSFHMAACALMASTTLAAAADLPSRRAPPVFVPPVVPVFTWTGFYIGGNAGAAFDRRTGATDTFNIANGQIAGSGGTAGTLNLAGRNENRTIFTGGGQIGFNYQLGSQLNTGSLGSLPIAGSLLGGLGAIGSGPVIGFEADAQYLDTRHQDGGSTGYTFTPNTPLSYGVAFVPVPGAPRATVVTNGQRRDDFFGTARGRLGFGFNRVLVYGTGGFAYNLRDTGYTVGGGIEYAITNNISVRGEYLYVDIGGRSSSFNPVYNAGSNTVFLNDTSRGERFSIARAALNYKFDLGGTPAPVVARY